VQLQKTLFDLQDSQHENTQMMKIVAHDLRNPISAIVQITQLIQMDKAIPEHQMSLVNMIQNSAGASLEFINDLLHLKSSFDNIKKEDLDISSVLQNSIELLNFKASEKNQQLHLETEDAFCMANREKLWRVFNNLIANAIKFSPENSVIHISLKKSGQKAICKIKDQGIGIPEDIKHQIFDLFTEAKRSGTSGEQSFGLGLAISKQIIEAHHGKIWFESEENNGTTFFIELPLYTI
jgi:signal transduction histidine kinase